MEESTTAVVAEETSSQTTAVEEIVPEIITETVEPECEVLETVKDNKADKTADTVSEYGSADSYSEAEEGEVRSRHSDEGHGDSNSEDSVILEREEGDGQESIPQRKVDDDEDKKNPQYIPKRGTFYEHDDRTEDVEEEAADVENEKEKDGSKKVWQDKKEKWSHDKFRDTDQNPKSRDELVAIYGYDIRNEDGPPRARRRRRYGRGPNKYTRNWEDEDAYNKPPLVKRVPRKPRKAGDNRSESDENGSVHNESIDVEPSQGNEEQPVTEDSETTEPTLPQQPQQQQVSRQQQQQPDRQQQQQPARQQQQPDRQQNNNNHSNNNRTQQRIGTGRIVKPTREFKESDYKAFTKPRSYPVKTLQSSGLNEDQHNNQSHYSNRREGGSRGHRGDVRELERDMGKVSLSHGEINPGNGGGYNRGGGRQINTSNGGSRQGSVPPRLQGDQKTTSKRYSSIRQRSLPETQNPPPFGGHQQQQHGIGGVAGRSYYSNDYNHSPPSQPPQPNPNQIPLIPPPPLQVPPGVVVPSTVVTTAPPPSLVQYGPAPPLSSAFVQAPPPPFLQSAGPPPFLPPPPQQQQSGVPPPQLLNYVPQGPPPPQFVTAAGQGGYVAAPPQQYQQQFNPVVQAQPTELYQPQGGITYYSPQDQQAAQRLNLPLKRPKAAIPIVPPPPVDPAVALVSRGRGRLAHNQQHQPVGHVDNTLGGEVYDTGNYDDNISVQ